MGAARGRDTAPSPATDSCGDENDSGGYPPTPSQNHVTPSESNCTWRQTAVTHGLVPETPHRNQIPDIARIVGSNSAEHPNRVKRGKAIGTSAGAGGRRCRFLQH